MSQIPVAVSWSGGKDAALALDRVLGDERYRVEALLCTVDMYRDRVTMHDVHRALVEEQARALELPLHLVPLPGRPDNQVYQRAMHRALINLRTERGIEQVVYGDIFLEEVRAYREAQLQAAGLSGLFPLWHRSTRQLANEFCARGYSAIVVCVDREQLEERFCGRRLEHHFFRELPGGVDPCGENGEFHSFVTSAPAFQHEIHVAAQPCVRRGRFVYCDLR